MTKTGMHRIVPLRTDRMTDHVQRLRHRVRDLFAFLEGLTLDGMDFTDSEAIAAIVRIAGGNFRLLQRLFAQIGRLLTLNGLHTLTKEVVEAVRECLIIGMT